ncbi:VanZ like protein [Pseudoduganella lurida]|uniref:VanZ like protein n=1 Tax=Pseudoduganella lurida TaxID=1036180 RepID=A0A562R1R0_9BURK|nr:VanZ family protein [Pseudoduganella lurida]TWI62977.1 VanZ like protein [Pseudoduganella lurida]
MGLRLVFVLLLYILLLFYGSWYPFAWSAPGAPLLAFLHGPLPSHWDKGDVVQNVLVYMPFGLLLVACRACRQRRMHFPLAVLLAVLCGTAVSLVIECGQQYLPARVPSLLDVAMNATGSIAGALAAAPFDRHTGVGINVFRLREAWCRPGPLAGTGLAVIGLWFLSQTSPLVPSLDIAELRHALGYLYRGVTQPSTADPGKFATLLCYQAGLGILLASLLATGRPLLRTYCVLMAVVFVCKLLVAGRVLSIELVAATACALPLLALVRTFQPRALATCGIALLSAGLVAYERQQGVPQLPWQPFNWVPFAGQMESLSGLENILEFLWPTMAAACLLRQVLPFHWQDGAAVVGTVLVGAGMFLLEWLQQDVPGRYGDITQAVLACAGWIVPWCVPREGPRTAAALAAHRH